MAPSPHTTEVKKMENKLIYGVTALFDTPDEIIHGAKGVEKAGYKKYDVHTPYPIHGMNSAMKLKPSKLGYFALVFGLSGTAIALLFMSWTNIIAYPNVIGGKPFFALPAFIPVTFELTVLLASIGTVLTMLVLFFRLPNNGHPLHDTHYMKSVSNDKFGICIEAKDAKFSLDEVKSLLESLGGKQIDAIYYDDAEISLKQAAFQPKFLVFLGLVAIIISGVSYFTLNKLLYMPPFTWMMEQDRLNAQSKSLMFSNGSGMRPPVEGTVARGAMPFLFKGEPDKAGEMLVNPLSPTKETLELGRTKFNTFCSPCHDYYGKGMNRLNNQFPNPPSLHSEKVRGWSDGRIYYVITEGQNIMPSYALQLSRDDRWAVVLYVRALQRALNAKEEDVK